MSRTTHIIMHEKEKEHEKEHRRAYGYSRHSARERKKMKICLRLLPI